MFAKMFRKYHDNFYVVFRILIGLLFFQHGAQKLLGWFGGMNGATAPLFSLIGAAGAIELVAGILITVGLFTRIASLFGAVEMAAAYFMAHASKNIVPLLNGGELALVYFSAFLVLLANGGQKWSLERAIFGKEVF